MTDDKVQGYWHVYSDGKRADIPFCSEEDKIFAMNNIAICSYRYGMEIFCLNVDERRKAEEGWRRPEAGRLVGAALTDDGQLLDFVGAAGGGGGGVDGYLEELAAGIENAQEGFLVGF